MHLVLFDQPGLFRQILEFILFISTVSLQLVGTTTALSLLTSSKISPVENAKGAKDVPGLHCSDAV